MDLKRFEYIMCTESARVYLGVCRQVMTNIPSPYADRDIIRRSKVFVLRRIQVPHSSRMKNCPRVECRRVSISISAIYKAAYGILSHHGRCEYWHSKRRALKQVRLLCIFDCWCNSQNH